MFLEQVIQNFARCAAQYDNYAEVQLQCANRLAAYIEANSRDITIGDILEVGCGTGNLSKSLIDMFSSRALHITDACPEMVEQCRARLSIVKGGMPATVSLYALDANEVNSSEAYALIATAFTLQWIKDVDACLDRMVDSLKPGGRLFFSVPTAASFPEWKAACRSAGVTFTGNALPERDQFRNYARQRNLRLSLYEETFKVNYASLFDFLQSIKLLGAGTTASPVRLSFTEMKRLLAASQQPHDDSFSITYKTLFGHFTKP